MFKLANKEYPVIAWWSGGATSAIVCKLCIDWFGVDAVRVVFIDTKNEDEDTYRFMVHCAQWYNKEIEIISNPNYNNIKDVWYKFKSLNVAKGAICSTELKRTARENFQKENQFSHQAFGFDIDEIKRAKALKYNYSDSKPIFPLITELLSKKECIRMLVEAGIKIPNAYNIGLNNNNCLKTGCVQGGIGYWQMIERRMPEKFDAMAKVEHELTDLKGQPVTMLKDQGKDKGLVFLKPHPKYPFIKDISMMKGKEPKPLIDCNGFCGTNDLLEVETEKELNFSHE